MLQVFQIITAIMDGRKIPDERDSYLLNNLIGFESLELPEKCVAL
jgi:hypothetical protein